MQEDRVALVSPKGERDFDVMYLALGCSAPNDLARSLKASCDEHGALQVNAHQETSVPGLYAAGDVVRGLNQWSSPPLKVPLPLLKFTTSRERRPISCQRSLTTGLSV
jgi:hypothetical protein